MLKRLLISDFALIDCLDIDFADGFNVITGETGAGKSIIMGALSLIMGGRADSSSVREGAKKCVVEALFSVDSVIDGLDDFDIDDELILRREMTAQGKSRAFVNDTPVNLQQLKMIASSIIDIHSQHQNMLLERQDFQLNVIDTVADNNKQLSDYQSLYKKYKKLCSAVADLRLAIEEGEKERDFDEYQYKQLCEARLAENEQQDLENELSLLEHAEEIKSELATASAILNDDESGVVSQLKQTVHSLQKATRFMNEITPLANAINDRYIELRELANDVEGTMNSVSTDQQRRSQVEQRLGVIYDLEQKHRVKTCDELLALQNELRGKLESVEQRGEELAKLENECRTTEKMVRELASELSKKRYSVKQEIEKQLVDRLVYLGIPNAKIEIFINNCDCSLSGCDNVEFRFSANKNVPLQPIGKIASGGEMSRVMLAIKAMMVENQGLQTIIFDEIDTGVSGEMAGRMGEVMQQVASCSQVIAITHLPQIAAKGNTHFKVFKQDSITNILKLNADQRVVEIAEMLSGHNPSQTALNTARELLNL